MDKAKIVVGIDGSDNGNRALEYAKHLASTNNSNLMLLHVIRSHILRAGANVDPDMQTQVRDTALNEYDEKFLEPKRLKLEEEGFDVDTEVVFGSPGHMLALEADRMQAEALIIGKIGNSKAKDILFGSVASRLVQHCPCPLIIVP